jgi:hypothetical protein
LCSACWRHPRSPADHADLAEAELGRLNGHVEAFISSGAAEARAIAVTLVVRDRGNVHALGSCIECQALERRECPATPRPAVEIHVCWYRRFA